MPSLYSPPAWSAWSPLPGAPTLTPATLAELLDGGQSFRWQRESDGVWLGLWGDHAARLRLAPSGRLEWSAPSPRAAQTGEALRVYLFGHDTAAALDALPWRGDPHLARCLAAFPGLAILRQPLGETLLGFICSSTKRIDQIKRMLALLATRHGSPISPHPSPETCHLISDKSSEPFPGEAHPESSNAAFFRLPTWEELAGVPEAALRACQLGFRAGYVSHTARFLAARPGWLEETGKLPYAEAKARLLQLPGVGEKIADCVLLFGAGKLEAFPVDTWIIKAMARRYGLDGWSPAQVAHFGRTHFGAHAGLAQQYLFAWERAQGKTPLIG